MSSIFLYPLAVLAGVAAACQGGANGALTQRAGLGAALIFNTLVVTVGSLLIFFLGGGPRSLVKLAGAPWSHYLGGLCGLIIIASIPLATPRLGIAIVLALMVASQGITAIVIDHFGLFGMPRAPLSLSRVGGALLLVAGVALMRR
jgi:bacterial/archaeal transporter family-2 protein